MADPALVKCPCGAVHELPAVVADLIADLGPSVKVQTETGTWMVPRAWIAAHGLKAGAVGELAAEHGWPGVKAEGAAEAAEGEREP